jgi:4-carboxymuconolactone decarboxylase
MIGLPVREPRTGRPGTGDVGLCFGIRSGSIAASVSEAQIGGPSMSTATVPRIQPLQAPYPEAVAETLRRMMPPGADPLKLFRTVARNEHVLERFRTIGAYLLNFGTLEPADREIVLHRTCARCGCEYEWGVHAAVFARNVGLSEAQLAATVSGDADDPAWSERESLLVRLADELHDDADVSDGLWSELARHWDESQLIELIAVAGFYHLVSFTANAARVEPEDFAERFPTSGEEPKGRTR